MIRIEIDCRPDEMDEHLKSLGFMRRPFTGEVQRQAPASRPAAALRADEEQSTIHRSADGQTSVEVKNGVVESISIASSVNAFAAELEQHERPEDLAPPAAAPTGATRIPGQPSPGRQRRTKAEIVEDYAYLQKHPEAAKPAAAISTGEERIDPAAEAQDAADEAAETAARAADKPTADDLRAAYMRYADKVTLPVAIKNIRDIIGCPLNDVPPEAIAFAISRVEAAIAGFTVLGVQAPAKVIEGIGVLKGGEIVNDDPLGVDGPAVATKADLVEASKAYGRRYDGSDDPTKMPNTMADLKEVFIKTFGPSVTGYNVMEKTPENHGKILAAINEAIRSNPFKREVRG